VGWPQKEKAAFTANLGGTSVVRVRAVSVIVEYVPVAHNPDMLTENERIEWDSGLETGALI